MKKHLLFCNLLALITSCVFTWRAESMAGEIAGFAAVTISMIGLGKKITDWFLKAVDSTIVNL